MELVRVTNIWLKLADGKEIPCIRATIRDYAGTQTATAANDLMREIYTKSYGMTTVCGFGISGNANVPNFIPNYNFNTLYGFGDNTGFWCGFYVYGRTTTVAYQQFNFTPLNGYGLWLQGTAICGMFNPSTSSSAFNYCALVILTDETNHIIYTPRGGNPIYGFEVGSSINWNAYHDNTTQFPTVTIQEGGAFTGRNSDWSLTTGADISSYIAREIDPSETDPYGSGGYSETGGGGGGFTDTSVPVSIPSLPSLSAADTGFITLFNPTLSELNTLATYMWSNPLFDLNAWKKIFADPMQAILGLSIVPVDVPAGTSKTVTVGNISTGINMTVAGSQYVEVDCGSIDVEEFWGAYLDYSPYTKAEIYLPYIGTHALQIDDIMGKTISCKYHVDILSGSCCAYLLCGDTVLYSFVGQCSSSIPITGDNWTNVINGALNIASAIGTMVATGGMSAPISAGSVAAATGRAIATDATLAGTAMTMKPEIERSGSMGGTGGLLGVQTPYLILTRPRQALPADQNKLLGYPSLITETLGDLEGWTVVQEIHLEGIACSSSELAEIETILKSGVIL